MEVYSIGFTKTAEAFFGLLKQAKIRRVVDVLLNLSVTDPPVEEKLKGLANGVHRSKEIGLNDERLLFCISLGETFTDGNCYKLVAGVVELAGFAGGYS